MVTTTSIRDKMASMWSNRRKRLLLSAVIAVVALFGIIATIVETVRTEDSTSATASDQTASKNEGQGEIAARPLTPTSSPPTSLSAELNSPTLPPSPTIPNAPPQTTPPPNIVYVCSTTDPTSVCYTPPSNNPSYCTLDKSLDPRLLYVAAPAVGNNNGGFAMEQPCAHGDRCTYACEPPYIPTENGWSNSDCIPYTALCPPYSPSTSHGGLYCNNGKLTVDNPGKPLCVLGLNTSFVANYVPAILSTCQTVQPGSRAPQIGMEMASGEIKQLASFPQWFWRGIPAEFYINLPGVRRITACQRNADPLSLNAQGLDTMPYKIGGGSLPGSPCTECAQHTLTFNDDFDFEKAYSKVPGFGVRVRNCNDETCGPVQCDVTYVYNTGSDTIEAYWVKYNTVFSSTSVGCEADIVVGYGWTPNDGMSKYTLYEYYPTTITGQQTPTCQDCSQASHFDPTRCKKIRQPRSATFGSGYVPAQFVCTPVGSAVNRASIITVLSTTETASTTGMSSTLQIQIFVACVFTVAIVGIAWRYKQVQPIKATSSAAALEPSNVDIEYTPDRRGSISRATYIPRGSTAYNEPQSCNE